MKSPPASIEPMTLTLGGLTALLHEQRSWFKFSLPVVDARSDARPPGMRPVADSILKSGTHSWEEIGHEKILRPHCRKQVALSALICRFSPIALWDLADFG